MTAFTYFKDEWTPVIDDYLAKHLASEVEDQRSVRLWPTQ